MTATPNLVTIVGNITHDLELKTISGDTKVVNFSVASTERVFDRETNDWKDGNTVFYRCSAWRKDAENLAASAGKGTRVIAIAKAKPNKYQKDGVDIETIEFEVQEIAASLAFATASISRTGSNGGGGNASQSQPAQSAPAEQPAPQQSAPAAVAADDDFS